VPFPQSVIYENGEHEMQEDARHRQEK